MSTFGMMRRSRRFRSMSGRAQTSSPSTEGHVERVKVRVIPPEQQPVEVASCGGLQAADFTVENCVLRSDDARDFLCELRPGFEDVAVARDQLAPLPSDVYERPKAINLRLEQKLGVIERLGHAQQAHRRVGSRHQRMR